MVPHMEPSELALFESFLRNSIDYVEFGSGGSTVLASAQVARSIISIDSSADWLSKVRLACINSRLRPELVHVDIGAVGEWGAPLDHNDKSEWSKYHASVWSTHPRSADADFFFVDGRFRVACFAQITLHCRSDAIIAIHDFGRVEYQNIRAIGREIASAGELSIFQPLRSYSDAQKLLAEFCFNCA